MPRLRTKKSEKKYHDLVKAGLLKHGCRLCQVSSLKEFTYWRIIRNDFPYDLIAKVHDMIVPKRHAKESELKEIEKKEYAKIKTTYLEAKYEFIVEPMMKLKSIPAHFHLHLIIVKN
jgi:hypothetical protein